MTSSFFCPYLSIENWVTASHSGNRMGDSGEWHHLPHPGGNHMRNWSNAAALHTAHLQSLNHAHIPARTRKSRSGPDESKNTRHSPVPFKSVVVLRSRRVRSRLGFTCCGRTKAANRRRLTWWVDRTSTCFHRATQRSLPCWVTARMPASQTMLPVWVETAFSSCF